MYGACLVAILGRNGLFFGSKTAKNSPEDDLYCILFGIHVPVPTSNVMYCAGDPCGGELGASRDKAWQFSRLNPFCASLHATCV